MRGAGEVLWETTEERFEATSLAGFLHFLRQEKGLDFTDYHALWQWSVENLSTFWRAVWDFFEPIANGSSEVVLTDEQMPGANWFPNIEINWAENMLRGPGDQVVVVARSQTRGTQTWTRQEMRESVGRARAGLLRLGVGPGDRVAAYMPNIPETVIAALATASLGAVWACCAPELGEHSVLDRFAQIEPKILLAVDGYRYGNKDVDRRGEVAALRDELPTLKHTVMVPYLFDEDAAAYSWDELLAKDAELVFDRVPFEHPLWILFSSGTTGLPKAIVHGHGGIVLEQLKAQALQCDLRAGDRYFVYCSTTWVMWNILISGMMTGATIVLFDGNPNYPDDLELWRVAAETQTTSMGCGAAFLLTARRKGLKPGASVDLSHLRAIQSTGSPLPPDGFRWVYEAVSSDVFLQSGSGGTDVCGGFVGGSPMLPVRAGKISCRGLGVAAEAYSPQGVAILGEPGELVITAPMPSMPIYFWNDPDDERYRSSYFEMFPGIWRHGDWVTFEDDGSAEITGRSDGTLNRGGVRLGTSEFYAVLDDPELFPEIDDVMVIHLEDPEGGIGLLWLFVALLDDEELSLELTERIKTGLQSRLSPRHRPDRITQVPAIPYNLTGKRLEVPIKRVLQGAKVDDVISDGSLRDRGSIDAFERLSIDAITT